jgi:Glycosyl transferase family 21
MSAGNGQLMAFRRAAYERVGGHALVRAEVLEDVRFAARLKARGGRLAVALGGNAVSVCMYRNYAETVEGFAKSLPVAHGGSRALLVASWLWHLGVYTWPWLGGRWGLAALGLTERLLTNVLTGRTKAPDLAEVLLTPLTPLAVLPIYWRALRGRYTWKGRTYDRRGQGD